MKTFNCQPKDSGKFFIVAGFVCLALTTGCKPEYQIKKPQAQVAETAALPKEAVKDCGPVSLIQKKVGVQGNEARAKYVEPNEFGTIKSLDDLKDPKLGTKIKEVFRYSQIDVTPRLAINGYPTDKVGSIPSLKGEVVKEFLGMTFTGFIGLNEDSEAGTYQLGLLADDGAILEIFFDGKWQKWVDGDGLHSVKLSCATKTLTLEKGQVFPFRLLYFQGPRDHLANMLLWRKVTDKTAPEVECGKQGLKYFFDPMSKTPLKPYLDIRTRGWQLVGSKNFVTSIKGQENHPCFQGLKQ